MSLFISFVQPNVTIGYMVQAFEDTFGADVAVQFGEVKKNQYGIHYKTAKVNILDTTRDLEHFKTQIRQHGNATFFHHAKDSWSVKLVEVAEVNKVKAKIV